MARETRAKAENYNNTRLQFVTSCCLRIIEKFDAAFCEIKSQPALKSEFRLQLRIDFPEKLKHINIIFTKM